MIYSESPHSCILAAMKNHSNATYVLGKAVYTLVSLATTSMYTLCMYVCCLLLSNRYFKLIMGVGVGWGICQ